MFKKPHNLEIGFFKNYKGALIRYGYMSDASCTQGTIVVCEGYKQFMEQYYGIAESLYKEGYAVYMFDWRGQGGSERYLEDKTVIHSEGFDEHVKTLHQFVDEHVIKRFGVSLILLAHSMGGNIGLRFLQEYKGVFDKAILNAPMLALNPNIASEEKMYLLTSFAEAKGDLDKVIPSHHFKDPTRDSGICENRVILSSVFEEIKAHPELLTKSPTWGFLMHAVDSMKKARDEERLKSVDIPVLIQISGKDTVVDKDALSRASALLPNSTIVYVPDVKHDVMTSILHAERMIGTIRNFISTHKAHNSGFSPQ